jgi:hypothetical protein
MKRLALLLLLPLLILGCAWSMWRYLWSVVTNPAKAWNIAYLVDELANVGANGKPNTTISARSARARNAGRRWGCVLCKVLNWFQANHCDIALGDSGRPSASADTVQ